MSSETCHRHPARLAVEHCETCRRPVCGSCLWYAETGQRLCPDHAAEALRAGQTVTPPERYAAGIGPSEVSAARAPAAYLPYKGNSTDLGALLAALAGLAALLSCAGFSWLLPILGFVLGLVAWLHARDSADPSRTRWLAGLGLAGGGIFIAFFFLFFAGFAMCMLASFIAAASQPSGFPTPLPFITPTP